ncbi:Protein trichome birefringence-like 25 [Ancistrocladus abbreviatus]
MVKEMRVAGLQNPSSLSLHKKTPFFIKSVVAVLLLGLAFRLFSSHSFEYSSVVDTPAAASLPPAADHLLTSQKGEAKCDLFVGDWIRDPSGPMYTNATCHFIQGHQNCMKNGRPDSEYLYWRWSPRDCKLPKFNGERFLHLMRNKSWAFIGDSISRNHVQSLLCILSQVEPAKEIYRDKEDKTKTWYFSSHNFTLGVIWAPLIVRADVFEDINGVSTSDIQLHLDKVDEKWSSQYKNYDYVIIAGGKWFLKTAIYYENDKVLGCHYCHGKNLTELGFEFAYRKALQLVFNFITGSSHKAVVFFRTITPDHFENGEWFSGGTCKRTVPFKEGEADMKDVDRLMHDIELQEFEKAATLGSQREINLKLLDMTRLSLLRPDGHPGPYRQFHPFATNKDAQVQNDCLHWCMPGPIDSWNDLIMEMLVNG